MVDSSSHLPECAPGKRRSKLPDVEPRAMEALLRGVAAATIFPNAEEARKTIGQLKSLVPPVETVYQPSGKTWGHQILLMIAGACLAGFVAVLLMYPAAYLAKSGIIAWYTGPKSGSSFLDFVPPPTGEGAPIPRMIWVALGIFIFFSTGLTILSSGIITTGFSHWVKNRNPLACGTISACGVALMITTLGIWWPGFYESLFGKFEMWELSKMGKTVSFTASVPGLIRHATLICISAISFWPSFEIGRWFVRTTKFSESANDYFETRRSRAMSVSLLPDLFSFLCQRDFKSLANVSQGSSFSGPDDTGEGGGNTRQDPVAEPPLNCYVTLEMIPGRVQHSGYVEIKIAASLKYSKGSQNSTGTESQSWLVFSEEWDGRDLEKLAGSLSLQS